MSEGGSNDTQNIRTGVGGQEEPKVALVCVSDVFVYIYIFQR